MDRFCGICGAPLEADGRCPKCGAAALPAAAPAAAAGKLKISGPKNPPAGARRAEAAPVPAPEAAPPAPETLPAAVPAEAAPSGDKAGKERAPKEKAPKEKAPKEKTPKASKEKPSREAPPRETPVRAEPPKKKKKKHGAIKVLVLLLILALLAFVILGVLQYCEAVDIPFVGKALGLFGLEDEPEEGQIVMATDTLERPDAGESLRQIGTIVRTIPVKESTALHTEAEAAADLRARGFTQFPITACYSIDGVLGENTEISGSAATVHPYYETYFAADDGTMWAITETNGKVTASPVSRDANDASGLRHVLSEEETVTVYDSQGNLFYEVAPDPSRTILTRVSRVDANALNDYSGPEEVEGT